MVAAGTATLSEPETSGWTEPDADAPARVVDPLAVDGDGGDSPAWSRKRQPYEAPGAREARQTPVPYAELHCHTNFSFLDGASHPEELAEEAARLGLTGLAVTDHDGFYGVVRFSEAARELALPTIFGAELSLDLTKPQNGEPDPEGRHLLVLAHGPEGYARLARTISRGAAARRGEGPTRVRRPGGGRRRCCGTTCWS